MEAVEDRMLGTNVVGAVELLFTIRQADFWSSNMETVALLHGKQR